MAFSNSTFARSRLVFVVQTFDQVHDDRPLSPEYAMDVALNFFNLPHMRTTAATPRCNPGGRTPGEMFVSVRLLERAPRSP